MSAEPVSGAYATNPNASLPSATLASNTSVGSQVVVAVSSQAGSLNAPIPGYAAISSASDGVRGDFNDDGQEDLLWRNYATGQNLVWLMNGTTRSTWVNLASVGDLNWRIQAADDFTGDGKTDILWRNYSTGQNLLWVMDGTSLASTTWLTTVNDLNWQIQGTGDFTGDNHPDILWRNYATGQDVIWAMNGAALASVVSLPSVSGVNLRIQSVADFNQDGKVDILWRNYLSGENLVWLMNGTTVVSTGSLTAVPNLNWQVEGTGDYNNDGKTDLLWRNYATGQNATWLMNNLSQSQVVGLTTVPDLNWQIAFQDTAPLPGFISAGNFSFNGGEGELGTFQIRLNRAPTTNVSLTLTGGNFLTVDADGSLSNGSQSTILFTPSNWNQPRTILFVAEADGSSANRMMGNTIAYSLSGGLTGSGIYDIGSVINTYAPDPTRFNIDLDFRNDYFGFWTTARRAIAQQAANDWAAAIANEWPDFQLNSTISRLETFPNRPYSFTTKRYVDDLLIFVNPYLASAAGSEPALGGPDYEFGGWQSSPATYGFIPRVGQIAVSPTVFANQPDSVLYQVVSHEIGHVLGLVGLNWIGRLQQDLTNPLTATFRGAYATATYGAPIPLQSQEGGDFYHPAAQVSSIMSYGWIYRLPGPTQIDYAMLADSGYRIYGFNA